MKQIDLEPRDYRSKPVTGEPIFVPGAGRKVLLHVTAFVALTVISMPVYLLINPFAEAFGKWFAGLFF